MSLQIDFVPSAKVQSPLRLGLASITLAVILGLAWSLSNETEAGLPPNHTLMPANEEVRSINSAIDDLNFHWLAVLNTFEPDARDVRMTIQGKARNSRAVLELPARLRSNPAITEARVISQSPASNTEARSFPIRFALEVKFQSSEGEQP